MPNIVSPVRENDRETDFARSFITLRRGLDKKLHVPSAMTAES